AFVRESTPTQEILRRAERSLTIMLGRIAERALPLDVPLGGEDNDDVGLESVERALFLHDFRYVVVECAGEDLSIDPTHVEEVRDEITERLRGDRAHEREPNARGRCRPARHTIALRFEADTAEAEHRLEGIRHPCLLGESRPQRRTPIFQ